MAQEITFDWHTGEDEYLDEVAEHFDLQAFDDPRYYGEADDEVQNGADFGAAQGGAYGASDLAIGFAGTDGAPARDGERALALFSLRAVAALLFVLLAAGGAPMSPDQASRQKIERELGAALELDAATWRARDRDAYAARIDPSVGRAWALEWRDGWTAQGSGRLYTTTLGATRRLDDDLVQAEVFVSSPRSNWWEAEELRETRFYREANGMWLRTLPPDSYWGEPLTLRTDYFVYHYHAPDAESVEAVAAQLEQAYVELYRSVGLGAPPVGEPIRVRVRAELPRYRGGTEGTVDVMSPILSQAPAGMSNAEYLADRVFSRVATDTLRKATSYRSSHRWAFVLSVTRNWLVANLLGQQNHWSAEAEAVFRADMADGRALALTDLESYYVNGTPGRETVLWRYAAADALLDYIVAQEGGDALPELVDGLSRVGSWRHLTEDVFDISHEEFEVGWNAYLAAEVGPQPAAEWAAR